MDEKAKISDLAEKRRFTRVPLKSRAAIRCGGIRVEGEVRNLSLSGLFVVGPGKLRVNASAEVEMVLAGPSSELVVELRATVVRQDEDGTALRFDTNSFELDAYLHLRNVISYLKDEQADTIMAEFYQLLQEQAEASDDL